MTATVTRWAERQYLVAIKDAAGHVVRADGDMELRGSALVTVQRPGFIMVGGRLVMNLGPMSLPKVQRLAVGESCEIEGKG